MPPTDIDALRREVEASIARGDAWIYLRPDEARNLFAEIDRLRVETHRLRQIMISLGIESVATLMQRIV